MAKKDLKLPKPRKTYPPPERRHHSRPLTPKQLERMIMTIGANVNIALESQDTKIADLNTKVDQFIASHPSTPPVDNTADNQAIVDHLTAQGQAIDAISQKLT